MNTWNREPVQASVIGDEEFDPGGRGAAELDCVWRTDGWIFANTTVSFRRDFIEDDDFAALADEGRIPLRECVILLTAGPYLYLSDGER